MRYLASSSHDIRTNLAIETYLMEHADLTEPILYFYINAPASLLAVTKMSRQRLTRTMLTHTTLH